MKVDYLAFKNACIDTFGANYESKIGVAARHQFFRTFWLYPAGGVAGKRKMIPLTIGAATNLYPAAKTAEQLESAITADLNDAGFGAGMSREQYIKARLLMAIDIAEMSLCDGYHDGNPRVIAAVHEDLEKECEDAILKASLAVGGHMEASNQHHTGLIDQLACLLSEDAPDPDYAGYLAAKHVDFYATALRLLKI